MQISSQYVIFLISCLLTFHVSADSLQSTLCKRDDIEINCNQNSTWAFDEMIKKCYPVTQGKEPCGFFQREDACIKICLEEGGRNVTDKMKLLVVQN